MTAIVASDVQFLLSAPSATSGNSAAGTPGNSRGNFVSTTQLSTASGGLDNLFTDLTGSMNAADQVDYQCLFVYNATASGNSMLNVVAWIPSSSDPQTATLHAIAVDNLNTGASALASSTAQAKLIATTTTAPSGITSWSSPSASNSGGVSLGTIAPGYVKAVWLRRTAQNSAPLNSDGFTIEVDFDTQG